MTSRTRELILTAIICLSAVAVFDSTGWQAYVVSLACAKFFDTEPARNLINDALTV